MVATKFSACIDVDLQHLLTLEYKIFLIESGISLTFYPNRKKRFFICMTIPLGTATAERCFLTMNGVLSWATNSLD